MRAHHTALSGPIQRKPTGPSSTSSGNNRSDNEATSMRWPYSMPNDAGTGRYIGNAFDLHGHSKHEQAAALISSARCFTNADINFKTRHIDNLTICVRRPGQQRWPCATAETRRDRTRRLRPRRRAKPPSRRAVGTGAIARHAQSQARSYRGYFQPNGSWHSAMANFDPAHRARCDSMAILNRPSARSG